MCDEFSLLFTSLTSTILIIEVYERSYQSCNTQHDERLVKLQSFFFESTRKRTVLL
jgi:hypothetical protein